jgi:hypothetical protein
MKELKTKDLILLEGLAVASEGISLATQAPPDRTTF